MTIFFFLILPKRVVVFGIHTFMTRQKLLRLFLVSSKDDHPLLGSKRPIWMEDGNLLDEHNAQHATADDDSESSPGVEMRHEDDSSSNLFWRIDLLSRVV
jgi:hypothetical protein